MKYTPSLVFTPSGIDACAYWRMWVTHINMPHSRFQFTEGQPQMNEISEQDVLMVQRMFSQNNVAYLKMAREHGIKIIYDLDDNIWTMPKYNPATGIFKKEDIQKGLVACAEWADIITCSTKQLQNEIVNNWGWLKNVASKKQIPVMHIDNAVDTKLFPPPVFDRDDGMVRIGWGGSNTHAGDIDHVWNLLPAIVEEFPNVELEFIGHLPPKQLIGHPRVKIREWVHISEFTKRYATWNWDIVLAPLEQHKFNRAKSSIKMQEAAAIKKPCLAENIAPYKYFASFKPELKWLLCDDYDWDKKLHALIKSKDLRREFGEMSYANLIENFNINTRVAQWTEACHIAFVA